MVTLNLTVIDGGDAARQEPLASYTYREGGALERDAFGAIREGETLIEALERAGFSAEPAFEVGEFASPVGLRVYPCAEEPGDYIALVILARRVESVFYVPDLPSLLDLLSDFRRLAAVPTRACA